MRGWISCIGVLAIGTIGDATMIISDQSVMISGLLLCASIVSALPTWKAIDLSTGRVHEWNIEGAPPTAIEKIHLRVTKTITDGSTDDVLVHILRLRWTPSHRWNDGTTDEVARSYNIICEIEQRGSNESSTVLDMSVASDITGIDERYSFPAGYLSLLCAVRPINAVAVSGEWSYSEQIFIDNPAPIKKPKILKNGENSPLESTVSISEHVGGSESSTVPPTSDHPMNISEFKELLKLSKLEEIPFGSADFERNRKPNIIVKSRNILEENEKNSTVFMEKSEMSDTEELIALSTEGTEMPTPEPLDDIEPSINSTDLVEEMNENLDGMQLNLNSTMVEDGDETTERPEKKENDVFFSSPRSNWVGNTSEVKNSTEILYDDETTTPLSAQEMADYDLVEKQLREALGVKEAEEAEILFKHGLGRVL